jgi:hypothetical protein
MAQNALTVTPENPTPPTNISSIGVTPPNPATYDPLVYSAPGANPQPGFDDTVPAYTTALWTLNEPTGAPSKIVFAAAHALVNVSTGLTSVAAEAAGTETSAVWGTNFGGNAAIYNPAGNLTMVGAGPAITPGVLVTPNASHPSTLSGSAVPTATLATGANNVSGTGTTLLTVTGTNFNRASVVNVSGIPQPTNYASATSLTVTNAQKKATSGTLPVTVTSNGITTASTNWTFT